MNWQRANHLKKYIIEKNNQLLFKKSQIVLKLQNQACMNKVVILILSFGMYILSANAQDQKQEVEKVVRNMFEGMRNADSSAVLSAFAPGAIMQTISTNKEGGTVVRQDQVEKFASFVGKQSKGAADEQIIFESIKIDGDLAIAWTPYKFYYNAQFSHCGVNSFTLVKINGMWKINYLIDTRRKMNCD
jgi:hypothetical protein